MRRFLLLLLLCLSIPSYAQEEGWPIVENCLGELPYPTIPQEDWDFEGVIFNYDGMGVRAIRTDVETSYYIAFENTQNFPAAGSFSPDGHWFAYPTGLEHPNSNNAGYSTFVFSGLSLVSTDPSNSHRNYDFPSQDYEFYVWEGASLSRYGSVSAFAWLDNQQLMYFGSYQIADRQIHLPLVLNIETNQFILDMQVDEIVEARARASRDTRWLPDNQSYIQVNSTENTTLEWFSQDNELIEHISSGNISSIGLSVDGKHLAFLRENRFHLANLEEKTIENLCLEMNFYVEIGHQTFLWSPDNQYLAFLYDGYPVLLNLETREMQILRYETWSLMAWYPLED